MRECELLSLRRREKREHRRAKYQRNRESVSVSGHMRPNRSECYVYSVVICMGRRCEWDLPRRKEFCEFSTVHLFGFVVRDVIVECHVGSDVVEGQKRKAVNVRSDFFFWFVGTILKTKA